MRPCTPWCQNGTDRVSDRVIELPGGMKMKTAMPLAMGAGLLLLSVALSAEPQKEALDERGRYEGVAASENTVWVVDTRTGRVRKCTQEFSDQTPNCSSFSR